MPAKPFDPASAFATGPLSLTDWQAGPLGDYYYPLTRTTGGVTNLAYLIDVGSTNAGTLGMYFYTSLINQAPEGHSLVDIGYHYTPPIVRLLTVTTNLAGAVDVDYHPPTNSLILSVNFDLGSPNNFDRVDSNRLVTNWSDVANALGEIPMTTARTTANGFTAGEVFYGEGAWVCKIVADGSSYDDGWAMLDTDTVPITGLHIDRTGVFGGDLIVVGCNWLTQWPPQYGGVLRIPASNQPGTHYSNCLAAINTYVEGVVTCTNDATKFGPWAGKILIGGALSNAVFAVDAAGNVTQTVIGFGPQDLHVIPTNQDFYCIKYYPKALAPSILAKVPRDFFVNITDDLIMIQSGEWDDVGQWLKGHLFLVHWDGTAFRTIQITDDEPRFLEHGVFTPLSLATEP